MPSKFVIVIFVIFFQWTYRCSAQQWITESDGIVYTSSSLDKDSLLKKEYVKFCRAFIQQFYAQKKLPLVYIVTRLKMEGVSSYDLSYDNLEENSTLNKKNRNVKRYSKPGIRIVIPYGHNNSEKILRLLEYGIDHLRELKQRRKNALKMGEIDDHESFSIGAPRIDSIFQSSLSWKVKSILEK